MEIIKSVFKNIKIRIVFTTCMVLCAVMLVQAAVTRSFSNETKITEAFATSDGIVISEKEVEATARLQFDRNSFYEESQKLFNDINTVFGMQTVSYEKEDEKMCVKASVSDDRYDINSLITWSEELNGTYLHCIINVKQGDADVIKIKQILEKMLDKWEAEQVVYVRISAKRPGYMPESECARYVDRMFNRLDAKEVYKGNDSLYIAYGYSKKLTDTITANNKLINVQVSLSYNEEKDLTEISLGYPIINTAY